MALSDLDRGWMSNLNGFEHDEPTRKRQLNETQKLSIIPEEDDGRLVHGYLALEKQRKFERLSTQEQEDVAARLHGVKVR